MLETLGLYIRELLAAAADGFSGSICIYLRIGAYTEMVDSRVARVMEGAFHADDVKVTNDVEDDQGDWCNISDETAKE